MYKIDSTNKIDFTKPLQILVAGKWMDVNIGIAMQLLRNKPEPRFVWLNVYDRNSLDTSINQSEGYARQARSNKNKYLHTLKVNVDTGETEKVYLS